MAAPHDVVHQINFGLQQDDGIAVVGGTMSDDDMLFWRRRLQVHLRLQRFGTAMPPDRALSTFEFPDGWTAIVRRWNSGGTIGRNDAMALIARSAWLPLPVVLGLDRMFGWETAARQRPFQRWDAEQLQGLGEEGARALRAPAEQLPDVLRRCLGRLFDAPEQPLTIVGCPDEQRIPLLWGLHKLAASRLLQQNVRRSWTFSTYEVEDADSIPHLPAIVFLPDLPVAVTVSRRTLVDARTEGNVSPRSAERAARRVELFLAGREDEPEFNTSSAAGPALAREAALVGGEPGRAGGSTVGGGSGAPPGSSWTAGAASTPRPGDGPRQATPGDGGLGPELVAAVEGLRQAGGVVALKDGMSNLGLLTAAPGDRAALRSWLGADGYARLAGGVVARLVRDERDQLPFFRDLHAVVFGPGGDDLRDDKTAPRFAVDVMQMRPPANLSALLYRELVRVCGEEVVVRALADRWLEEHGVSDRALQEADAPPATSVAPLTPVGGEAAQSPRWWPAAWWPNRHKPPATPPPNPPQWWNERAQGPAARPRSSWSGLAVGTAAIVVAVIGVLAYVALFPADPERARSSGAAVTSTAPAATSAAPSRSAPSRSEPDTSVTTAETGAQASAWTPTVTGTVAGRDLQVLLPMDASGSGPVYLLLHPRSGGAYYYRGQCAEDETRTMWACRESSSTPAVPEDDQGYDVAVVERIGGQSQDLKKRFVVPPPEQADFVVGPVVSA